MTIDTPAIAIPIPRRPGGRRGRLLGLAGALAAAVVVAAGVALWQGTRGDEALAPTPEAALPTSPARPVGAATVGPTYYLVSSPEQAVLVQADIDATGAYLEGLRQAGHGVALPEAVALLAGTPEDEGRAAQIISDTYYIRLTTGQPDLRVVDLRAPAVSLPPLDPAASSDAELYQRWRQAQAASAPEPVSHPDRD